MLLPGLRERSGSMFIKKISMLCAVVKVSNAVGQKVQVLFRIISCLVSKVANVLSKSANKGIKQHRNRFPKTEMALNVT